MRISLLLPAPCLLSCTEPPPAVRAAKKLELISNLQRDLLAAMEAEKSAVLSTTDEESIGFADESKRANAQVEAARVELRRLVEVDNRDTEVAALTKFEDTWREVQKADERLLALAVANTNLKASASLRETQAPRRPATCSPSPAWGTGLGAEANSERNRGDRKIPPAG